jgi:plastocyanin
MRARSSAGLLVAAVLLLSACGGESSKGGYATGPSAKQGGGGPAPPSSAPSAGVTARVTMTNVTFKPGRLTARVGQSVQWTNQDGVPHDVKAVKGDDFKSQILQPGQTYRYQLGRAGTVQYVCTIHPTMKATIRVRSSAG